MAGLWQEFSLLSSVIVLKVPCEIILCFERVVIGHTSVQLRFIEALRIFIVLFM